MARQIKLLIVQIPDEGIELNYREQYLSMLRKPIEGVTIAEMEIAIRLITALKQAKDKNKIVIEEDEFNFLSNLIKKNKWAFVSVELLDMIKNITEAKSISIDSAVATS